MISGAVSLGRGQSADHASVEHMPAGSFASMPAGVLHYVFVDEDAVLQVNSAGPWVVDRDTTGPWVLIITIQRTIRASISRRLRRWIGDAINASKPKRRGARQAKEALRNSRSLPHFVFPRAFRLSLSPSCRRFQSQLEASLH